MKSKITINLYIFLLFLLLSGCAGFKLRTNQKCYLPEASQPIFIEYSQVNNLETQRFYNDLNRILCQKNIKISEIPNKNILKLDICYQELTRAFSSRAQTEKLQIIYKVNYHFAPGNICGRAISTRNININQNQMLSNDAEKQQLLQAMRTEVIRKLLCQLTPSPG